MRFYLGTHRANWLSRVDVPLCVSRRRLERRKTLPEALGPWILDSGGFTELSMYGEWMLTPEDYVNQVRRLGDGIGNLQWAAPQDWMCEPAILERTGLDVRQHQRRTVDNLIELRSLAPDLTFIPVLQGWEYGDYLQHLSDYADAGIELTSEPVVGLGSVAGRQGTTEAAAIVTTIRALGVRLHGFGIKITGLTRIGLALESSDSMAWSYQARYRAPLDGCTHKSCANCLPYALRWRDTMLARLGWA